LANAVESIAVFSSLELPAELRRSYAELHDILGSGRVPAGAENHPDVVFTVPALYLHWSKARHARDLILEMYEQIVFLALDEDM